MEKFPCRTKIIESLNRFRLVVSSRSATADKMNERKFLGIKESIKKEYLFHIYCEKKNLLALLLTGVKTEPAEKHALATELVSKAPQSIL